MSLFLGEISARITADSKGFDRSINDTRRKGVNSAQDISASFQKLGGDMQRVGLKMTAMLTAPIVLGMRQAVKESALLEGAMAKFNVVFAEQAGEVEEWVNEFRKGVPLARREIVQAAASMQDLLVPMGVAREDASDMTKEWLELAAALAAFNDVPVSQALDAIRSGIAGQSRPLREFGINASVAAVEQTALAHGLIRTGEQMSDQVRQQALLIQAYEQSADAVNGYQNQLGTTLMIEQELSAAYKDTLAVLGNDLKPTYDAILGTLVSYMHALKDMDEEQRKTTLSLLGLSAGLPLAAVGIGTLIRLLPALISPLGLLAVSITAITIALKMQNLIINEHISKARAQKKGQDALLSSFKDNIKAMQDYAKEMGVSADSIDEFVRAYENMKSSLDSRINDLAQENAQLAKEYNELGAAIEEAMRNGDFAVQGMQDRMEAIEAQMQGNISTMINYQVEVNNMRSSIDDFGKSTETATTETQKLGEALSMLKPSVEAIPPIDEIMDLVALEEYRKELELLNMSVFRITDAWADYAYGAQVAGERTQEATLRGGEFANIMGSALAQATLHGSKLSEVVAGLIKQFASRAFVQGIAALLTGGASLGDRSFFGAVFGGIFHGGGIVGGSGERMIKVKGGEGVFTPSQMNAMGRMTTPTGIDSGSMQRAFENALRTLNLSIDNERLYLATKQGERRYA
jgi:uncharacterized protein YeeX (DUF496 family)